MAIYLAGCRLLVSRPSRRSFAAPQDEPGLWRRLMKKRGGFIITESLIAVALAAIISGILLKFFLLSWNINSDAIVRVNKLEELLQWVDLKSFDSKSFAENMCEKEVVVRTPDVFKKHVRQVCGCNVEVPATCAMREVEVEYVDVRGKKQVIRLMTRANPSIRFSQKQVSSKNTQDERGIEAS